MMIHKNQDTIHPRAQLPPVAFVFSKPDQGSRPTLPMCCTARFSFGVCLTLIPPPRS
ncbi:hypothetical protein GE21DRAFT_1304976 [Neurospora crassa]|nr:hypothetical protein GE21DRAFT_1304976 [Neurospora crassa]